MNGRNRIRRIDPNSVPTRKANESQRRSDRPQSLRNEAPQSDDVSVDLKSDAPAEECRTIRSCAQQMRRGTHVRALRDDGSSGFVEVAPESDCPVDEYHNISISFHRSMSECGNIASHSADT
jgi:hypothetical protein